LAKESKLWILSVRADMSATKAFQQLLASMDKARADLSDPRQGTFNWTAGISRPIRKTTNHLPLLAFLNKADLNLLLS
jgi:hypothetical protein